MYTQSIIQVGNSHAVAIPSHIMKDLNLKKGQKVIIDKTPDSEGVIIKPVPAKSKKSDEVTREFESWLKMFFQEDGGLLDDLATR